MEEVSNMPLLDENKNSPIPEPHKPEKKELSVSSLTSGAENIAPQIIFENPASPKGNISESNSYHTIQTKNNLNALASEIEVGVSAPDTATLHDASNGSFLGDAGVSFKSCNDSFLGDDNNSFKSLNGSYVIVTTSPKMLDVNPLNETITTTQSTLLQPNNNASQENTNLSVSFETRSSCLLSKDASFTKDQSTNSVRNILNSPVVLPLPHHPDDKDVSSVFNDSGLGGALAAFSSLKLDDSVVHPLKCLETTLDVIGNVQKLSNMEISTVIQDIGISDKESQVPVQVDSPATVNINKNIVSQISEVSGNLPQTSDGALFDCLNSEGITVSASPSEHVPQYLEGATCNNLFDLKDNEASPSEIESSTNVPEASADAICNNSDTSDLKGFEVEASPHKTEPSENVPEALAAASSDPLDSKSVEAVKSPSETKSSGNIPEASGDAACNHSESFDLNEIEAEKCPHETESSKNVSEALDAVCNELDGFKDKEGEISPSGAKVLSTKIPEVLMLCNEPVDWKAGQAAESPLKTDPSGNVPFDFKRAEDSPSKDKNPGNGPEVSTDAICQETFYLNPTENVDSPVKTSPMEKICESLDNAMSNNSFELKGAKVETSHFENETFGTALCDDPFNLKSFEAHQSPVDDFVFKVPETPTNTDDEQFTDAVQFFKDPSSFQFLESIKTSSKEEHVPRSSLYIKFDPLHSTFPKNPSSSDVLQALEKENLDANQQCLNVSPRESLGNILISFDSPRKSGGRSSAAPVIMAPAKVYTEEELQKLLNVNELTNQEILLKKQREMEEDLARKEKALLARVEEKDGKIACLEKHIRCLKVVLDDLADASLSLKDKQKDNLKILESFVEENTKLKGEVKTVTEDFQSVETTFSDFHKRYEQCKGMLKTYKENEELLKTQLNEQQQAYQMLQESTGEALEKASSEVASVKKTSEAQTAVLKAQLKKAEMKISSLESDIKQIKIENSQLGGICDDLMEKVGKS